MMVLDKFWVELLSAKTKASLKEYKDNHGRRQNKPNVYVLLDPSEEFFISVIVLPSLVVGVVEQHNVGHTTKPFYHVQCLIDGMELPYHTIISEDDGLQCIGLWSYTNGTSYHRAFQYKAKERSIINKDDNAVVILDLPGRIIVRISEALPTGRYTHYPPLVDTESFVCLDYLSFGLKTGQYCERYNQASDLLNFRRGKPLQEITLYYRSASELSGLGILLPH